MLYLLWPRLRQRLASRAEPSAIRIVRARARCVSDECIFYLTGARAGVVVGSNPRSMKKSVRRRADSTETGGGNDANQTTNEEIEECEEADPDPAWSPECWGHHSSVDKELSCNCFGPMKDGA